MFGRWAMSRSLLLLAVPSSLVLAGGIGGMGVSSRLDHGPVYSVAAVRAHLAHDAKDWVGRQISVRGRLIPCMAIPTEGDGPCAALAPDPGQPSDAAPASPAIDPLPLTRGDTNPLLAHIWRVPILGNLMPALQEQHWGAAATYRVSLRAVPNSLCGTGPCYEAVLLDAAP
jgi:hypothetical protein